jgi:hypothetical protein
LGGERNDLLYMLLFQMEIVMSFMNYIAELFGISRINLLVLFAS